MGQDVTKKIIASIVLRKQFESAYTFSGPSGTGKTTLGRIFSQMILCQAPTENGPCEICDSCKLFKEGKHFGYKELDAATFSSKEDMITLRDDAFFQPLGDKKIILLDECHDISKQGQDALLLQLENCPEHLTYIFCTTNPDKMEPTLRRRCIEFQIHAVDPINIADRLEDICKAESIVYERDALLAIAEKSEGNIRYAIHTLEKTSYFSGININSIKDILLCYDSEVCDLILNLGDNINNVIKIYRNIISLISVRDLYTILLELLTDASKLIYGYDNFNPNRKLLLEKLNEKHGLIILEFLNYLIQRDKYVDKIGIQSDLVLLHYKFSSNSFIPAKKIITENIIISENSEQNIKKEEKNISTSSLYKMDVKERNRVLRQRRDTREEKINKEKIPTEWPMPKEQRVGEDSSDKDLLSPQEFSHRLVGGRGGHN